LFPEVREVTLRREDILTVIALLVVAAAIPSSIMDTIETGRVYLFSQQFLDELPRRFTGPGSFRFVLQSMLAILLGVRGGLVDAREGNSPYLFGLLFNAGRRRELLRNGLATIRSLISMGIILEVVFQLVIYHEVHAGAALLIGPIFICGPYALSRAVTTRLVQLLERK